MQGHAGSCALQLQANKGVQVLLRVGMIFLLATLTACASVPSQEMSDARRALDAANQADAKRMAPHALQRASAAFEQADSALRSGQYDNARSLAGRARDEAIVTRQLSTQINDLTQAITAAREQGKVWQGAENLLQHARQMSADGDSSRALALVRRAASLLL